MPAKKLREFLDDQGIKYVAIPHQVGYTARQIATLTHTPNKELAKTVIVKIDGALAIVVLPASYAVDLSLLRAATGARIVNLAKESEFKNRFPECEIGAMPPFGNLYGMAVYVEESLTKDERYHSMLARTTSCSRSPTPTSNGLSIQGYLILQPYEMRSCSERGTIDP
jgi:Ala-tRNA(Pro) deacylase